MGLINAALPTADADDTYKLSDVQKLRGDSTIKAIKAAPGSTLIFKQALLIAGSGDPDTGSSSPLVNDKGEVVINILVGSKTTATGRVARIGPFFSAGVMSQNQDFFYQIG
ncbi:MAG: hypothetical protein LQ342_000236 [Letrouitia transgressa]|nr:MAG: hypothetical protein LQ342_000236 [Letrouitia transgressa]